MKKWWSVDMRQVRRLLLSKHEETLPDFKVIRQPADMVCWAACYRMVDEWRYHNRVSGWCHHVRCSAAPQPPCDKPEGQCNKPRPTTRIAGDWLSLGYANVKHQASPCSLVEVRAAVKLGIPTMAFLERPGQTVGHYVLIVGTGRARGLMDNTYLLADPEKDAISEVPVTDMPYKAFWRESWRIGP